MMEGNVVKLVFGVEGGRGLSVPSNFQQSAARKSVEISIFVGKETL